MNARCFGCERGQRTSWSSAGAIPGSARKLAVCRRRVVRTRQHETILHQRGKEVPNLASQMRAAFSSMAWNTGCSSPGELTMTSAPPRSRSAARAIRTARACAPAPRRTAARSRSRSPPGRRRWSTSSICLSVNGRTAARCRRGRRCSCPLAQQRHAQHGAVRSPTLCRLQVGCIRGRRGRPECGRFCAPARHGRRSVPRPGELDYCSI